jgi:hypothetical protein
MDFQRIFSIGRSLLNIKQIMKKVLEMRFESMTNALV